MMKRRLGKSGLSISEIGLGCWQLGGDFGPIDDERASRILDAAFDAGIDFWDTADVYGAGLSETRVAAAARRHEGVVVATKVGRDPGLYPDGYTKVKVRRSLEASARRLGVATIDLAQLHCVPRPVLEDGALLSWMEDFQDDGLIRHFGASVETLDEALFAARHPRLTSLQIIFNVFRQDAIQRLFPVAEEHDVGIIVRLPLASGILAGKTRKDRRFDPTDHRQYNRHGEFFSQGETFSGIPFEAAVDLVEELRGWVPADMTMAQFAMRWILDFPAVTTVIAGASRPAQAIENGGVSGLAPLPPELHEQLAGFYRRRVAGQICVPV
jgi:aryl-alcohol dehydrogenase-like predicted oxidoreductase